MIRNCLLVGGDGYIGTNLQKLLVERNIEPFVLDKTRGQDASQLTVLEEIDYIVMLAAYPGVKACKENLKMAMLDNISPAVRVFHLAHQNQIPVIFLSSQAAKKPEDNIYGLIKYWIEQEAHRLNYLNADIRCLRLTNVYGGDCFLRKLTAVPNIVRTYKWHKTGNDYEPFVINGTGMQQRDFIHVDDVCEAIYKCMMHPEPIKEPFDIGTGNGTSILDLVEMFGIEFTFNPNSDIIGPDKSIADVSIAKELINFESLWDIKDWINNIKTVIEKDPYCLADYGYNLKNFTKNNY